MSTVGSESSTGVSRGASPPQGMDIGTRVLLGTGGLLILCWLGLTWYDRSSGTTAVTISVVVISAAYCLAGGLIVRSWGWLAVPWVAALIGIIGFGAFMDVDPAYSTGLKIALLTISFGGWAVILTVATALGIWIGKRRSANHAAVPPTTV